MFGLHDRPSVSPIGLLPAETKTGIKVMSINLLLPNEDEAVIWRGPLKFSAIRQFIGQVDWGDLDFQDLMAAVDFVEKLPFIDSERMAVIGGSYGGFMVTWMIGHTDRFRCAITERGVSNRHSAIGTTDNPPMPDGYWSGNIWDRPKRLWQQSPLRLAGNIHTPLLIIHSEGDLRCPIGQAEQLYSALKRLKCEVTFLRYPVETSHGLSRNGPPDLRLDRLERIKNWLDQYLK
jgi:acylaminoacyl-peptidase